MKKIMTALLLCMASTSFAENLTGWQGVPWGAPESVLLKQFKGQIRKATPGESNNGKALDGTVIRYVIPDYEIDGDRFLVKLAETPKTHRLKGVWVINASADTDSYDTTKFDLYDRHLREKYGNPTYTKHENHLHRKFLPMASAENGWVLGDTVVELNQLYLPKMLQSISIVYRQTDKKTRSKL